MSWSIEFSHSADKFIDKNQITKKKTIELVKKAVRYFRGEDINVDVSKLKGKWKGFYRIRKGDTRIIAEFNSSAVFIKEIDNRGNVYK